MNQQSAVPGERLDQRPRLSRAVHLRFDPYTRSYVLLSPERGLRLNSSATEVVLRCNGQFTLQEIISELLTACAGEDADSDVAHARIALQLPVDVLNLIAALEQRRLLIWEPNA